MRTHSPTIPAAADGATLAASVRELARDAHRLIHDDLGSDGEARGLLRRLAHLRRLARGLHTEELGRWLDSLRQAIEDRRPAIRRARRPA